MQSKCLCFSNKVLVFSCSGGSVFGEISDRTARSLSRKTGIKMGCLAGLLANTIKFTEDSRKGDYIISLDGCQMACATRTLCANGFRGVISFSVENMTHGRAARSPGRGLVAELSREIVRLLKTGFEKKSSRRGRGSAE